MTDTRPSRRPDRGDAQGRAPPPPRRLAPRRDGARPRPDPRRRRAARLDRACRGALVAPEPCVDQAELLARVRPPDRAHAGRRGARADRRASSSRPRPPRTSATWRSAGARCSTSRAACRSRTGSRRSARAPQQARPGPGRSCGSSARRCARTTRPTNVVLAETAARFRDQGLTGWDLAGPEAAFPDPGQHAARVRGGARRRPADHAPRRRVGRRRRRCGARSRWTRSGSPMAPCAIDDPALCAELASRGVTLDLCPTSNWQAGIVGLARGSPARPAPPGRRAGDAQHRRPHRLRHHAVRGVRQRASRRSG